MKQIMMFFACALFYLSACGYEKDAILDNPVDPESPSYIGRIALDEDGDGISDYADPDEPYNIPKVDPGLDIVTSINDTVIFHGSAVDSGSTKNPRGMGTIVKYEWDFDGDGVFDWSSETAGEAMHVYTESGIYQAVLRVIDDEGNTSSAIVTAKVSLVFPDSNFEAVVRSAISKSSGHIFPDDVAGLIDFYTYERNIVDLGGIEWFTHLTSIANRLKTVSRI